MKEQLVTSDTAKLTKEKGFDIPCNYYIYTPDDLKLVNKNRGRITGNKKTFEENHIFKQRNKYHKGRLFNRNKYTTTVSVPTQSLLQKWLREIFKLWVWVEPDKFNKKGLCTYYIESEDESIVINEFSEPSYKNWVMANKDYEEALEKGLQEALKLIK